jgi:hypothetical protein
MGRHYKIALALIAGVAAGGAVVEALLVEQYHAGPFLKNLLP